MKLIYSTFLIILISLFTVLSYLNFSKETKIVNLAPVKSETGENTSSALFTTNRKVADIKDEKTIGRSIFFKPIVSNNKSKKEKRKIAHDLQLIGVIISDKAPIAVIRKIKQSSIIRARIGSKILGWQIIKIDNKQIIIIRNSKKIAVKLGEKV